MMVATHMKTIKMIKRVIFGLEKLKSWMGGWMNEWMDVKTVLRIAYRNKKHEIRSLGESIVYVTIVTWAGRL